MMKHLSMILFSLIFSSCFFFAKNDPADDAPSYTELQGVYRCSDTSIKAELILASDADMNENHMAGPFGQYVLELRNADTMEVDRGFWDYIHPPAKNADYGIGPNGYSGITFKPFSNRKIFIHGLAHFDFNGSRKRLIIECPVNDDNIQSRFRILDTTKRTFTFEKKAYNQRYKP